MAPALMTCICACVLRDEGCHPQHIGSVVVHIIPNLFMFESYWNNFSSAYLTEVYFRLNKFDKKTMDLLLSVP